jgi:hypothetical protein
MLRSPIKDAWIAAEKLEMEGLSRRKCWVRVLKSTLTAQDKVFSTRFHYKIKRKQGQFEKCKVRLVVQGQHMHRKDDQGRGDFEDAFSPVCIAIMWISAKRSFREICFQVTGTTAKFTFLPLPVTMKTPTMSTNCVGPFTACQAQLAPGTTP